MRTTTVLLITGACGSGLVESEDEEATYMDTVYVAPTWDLTAEGPPEVDEATIRKGLAEIRSAFGTGVAHGPHAQPGITFYCRYEAPLDYTLAADPVLQRNLRLAVELGLPYRIILHGGQFTGTLCEEEPLSCFLKQTSDDWLMGDPAPFEKPAPGAEGPPYVTISRYNSVYYVRKVRNLRAAIRDLVAWMRADARRRELFIGFSKDPETVVHPSTGRTTDPCATAEFQAWARREGIYGPRVLTIPADHHPGATAVRSVTVQVSKGERVLEEGEFTLVGLAGRPTEPRQFGLVLIDAARLSDTIAELSEATYVVVGGEHDGQHFASRVWVFSDDPEGDGGEWMTRSSGDHDADYRAFMRAMVEHHVEDILRVMFDGMRESGVFADDAEIASLLYTHEVPGGDWDGLEGPSDDDYDLLRRFAAPLLPDPAGNWSSVAGSARASPGIDVFGVLSRDRQIFAAVRSVAAAGNWGLMEWNAGSEDLADWRASLDLAVEHGVHVVSLQGWETIAVHRNEVARRALSDFLVRLGGRPYIVGNDNR